MFDVTGLVEVNMHPNSKVRGSYYLNESGELVAKTCASCAEIKSGDEFPNHAAKRYGKRSYCRTCHNKRNADHYMEIHGEKSRARKEYLAANPNKYLRKVARFKSRTPVEVEAARNRLRPDGLKCCVKCKQKLSFDRFGPDLTSDDGLYSRCKACHSTAEKDRRARGDLTYWSSVGIPVRCYVCDLPHDHADHVVPTNLGGEDVRINKLPMCSEHNTSKQDTPLLQWLRERHPDKVEEVMIRVLSYGVRPYTRLDVWTEVPADHVPRIEIQVK